MTNKIIEATAARLGVSLNSPSCTRGPHFIEPEFRQMHFERKDNRKIARVAGLQLPDVCHVTLSHSYRMMCVKLNEHVFNE